MSITVDQRMSALDHANMVRFRQAEIRAELRSLSMRDGRSRVAELIESREHAIERFRVLWLMTSIFRFSEKRATRLLTEGLGVQNVAARRVEDMTDRQRAMLAKALRS